MTTNGVPQLEQNIARCRVILSLAAIAAVYIDPAEPLLSRWIPLVSGAFVMDFRLAAVVGAHHLQRDCLSRAAAGLGGAA
jgi:hypothetical protein